MERKNFIIRKNLYTSFNGTFSLIKEKKGKNQMKYVTKGVTLLIT